MLQLLYLNLKLSSAKLSNAFGAIMYLVEPKGGEGGRSLGFFYCLNLSDAYI
jgi:hypothetical protein